MKKIMAAFAVVVANALVASSASAYTVINTEKFNYTIGGDFEIRLGKPLGKDDVDVIFDDSLFKNKITYKLDRGNTVFSHLEFDPRNDDSVETFFVGTTFKNSSILIGENDNAAYSFGVEGGRLNPAGGESGSTSEHDFSESAFSVVSGSDLIMLQSKLGSTTIKLSHDLAVGDGDETDTALFVSSKFGKVGVGFAYQRYEAKSTDAISAVESSPTTLQVLAEPAIVGEKADVWGVQASIAMNASFTLAADFSTKDSDVNDNDTDVSNLLGAYKKGKNIFWIGLTERDTTDVNISGWYTGINHRVTTNVNVFVEVADDDLRGNDTAFLTGVRLKF